MSKNDKELLEIYFDRGVDLKNRRIFLLDDIDIDFSADLLKGLFWLSSQGTDPISIFVSSYGGSEYDMMSLYDTIRYSPVDIHTIASGKCMSAAPLLVAAGTKGKRFAMPNTWFMIHDGWIEAYFKKRSQMKSDLKHYDALHDQWLTAMAENSERPKEFWAKICKEPADRYFDTNTAIEYGLIDAVWKG